MSAHTHPFGSSHRPPRRTSVKGLAFGAAAAGIGLSREPAWAQGNPPASWRTLAGSDFDLRIGETPLNLTGSPRIAFTVNGSVPAPTLLRKEGDTVTLRVSNTLDEDASISMARSSSIHCSRNPSSTSASTSSC